MSDVDYSALAAKFGGVPVNTAPPDYSALAAKYGGHPVDDPLTPFQGAQALATGFNRSILAGLPGLPVKTALDVADLARAGYGALGLATGMLKPEDAPEPLNRARYFGSPEYIAQHLSSNPVGSALIDNPRADNPTARVLNAGGAGIGAGVSGSPGIAGMQFASGAAGQVASELGAPPSWSILASMGPQAGMEAGAMGVRGAMRGGDEGRTAMIERTGQFQNAGVQPTVGLATGNRGTQAIESLLSKTPGGAGVMAAKVANMQGQMQNTANAARDAASPVFGPVAAGEALKQGIAGYRNAQQNIYSAMINRALGMVPEGMTFPVSSMLARGGDTLAAIPGAPNVTATINKPLAFTQDVVGALQKDAAPQPPGSVPSPILQPSGQPFTTPTPGTPGGLPFEGIQGLKQRIGQIAYQTNPLLADANQGALKYLYSGAKQDLQNAGNLADAERITQGQQPGVANALNRADTFYTRTNQILEDVLGPIYNAGTPASEKSFYRVESDLRNSGQSVTRAMASLPLATRRVTAATVIDRLGKANPGAQNAEGNAFSAQTFLTNWARISPEAKSGVLLGIPNGSAIRSKLDSLANAASMMRDASKVYSNSSGTASSGALIGQGAGIASGLTALATGHPAYGAVTLAGILSSMTGAYWGAKAMTNPKVVNWLSQATYLKPNQMMAHVNRLAVMAGQEQDPQTRAGMLDLADKLRAQLQQ